MGQSIPVVGTGYTFNITDGKHTGGSYVGHAEEIDYAYVTAHTDSYNKKIGVRANYYSDFKTEYTVGIVTNKPSGIEINYTQLDQSANYIIKY